MHVMQSLGESMTRANDGFRREGALFGRPLIDEVHQGTSAFLEQKSNVAIIQVLETAKSDQVGMRELPQNASFLLHTKVGQWLLHVGAIHLLYSPRRTVMPLTRRALQKVNTDSGAITCGWGGEQDDSRADWGEVYPCSLTQLLHHWRRRDIHGGRCGLFSFRSVWRARTLRCRESFCWGHD